MTDTTDRIDKRLEQIKALGWLLAASSEHRGSIPDAIFYEGASVIEDLSDALRADFDELLKATKEQAP